MASQWNKTALLSDTETGILDSISECFQAFNQAKVSHTENESEETEVLLAQDSQPKLSNLISQLTESLATQESLALQNLRTVGDMEKHKGTLMASTKDFQQTCLVVFSKQQLLRNVIAEIERHQDFYKLHEVCQQKLNNATLMESSEELARVTTQVQQGIDFFTANANYRRADLYRQRFVYQRQQALQMVQIKILKNLREANTQNTLRVNQLRAEQQTEVRDRIYVLPRNCADVQDLSFLLHVNKRIPEFHMLHSNIFAEYFDNRKYLLNQYFDGLCFKFNALSAIKLDQIMAEFIVKYLNVLEHEEDYFKAQFSTADIQKFDIFIEQSDFLRERLSPYISKAVDFSEIAKSIDIVHKNGLKELEAELQDKLLSVVYMRIRNVLSKPSGPVDEYPLQFVDSIRLIIYDELEGRLRPDIFKGVVLEVV